MGLDMYLQKKTYVGRGFDDKKEVNLLVKNEKTKHIIDSRINEIVEEAMYWRKANAIHKWFIDNCADGDGDKSSMYVSYENLKDLLEICKEVIANSK
jgi:pectin methylesterase-like acyl-CoA thioesterase